MGKLQKSEPAPAPADTGAALGHGLRGKRVLLVEDNDINQEVAQGILESAGIQLFIANDGEEGVAAIRRSLEEHNLFDAVLMDCHMPVLDGYEATRILRRESAFSDLPIIAMTANAMAGDREKCLAAGMNDHVAKPINCNELFATLERWICGRGNAPEGRPKPDVATEEVSGAPFLDLPGVDVQDALSRIGNDTDFYVRILRKFADGQRNVVQALRAAIQTGDMDRVHYLAHTLKGVTANLGATEVCQAAREVEAQSKVPGVEMEPLLMALHECLGPLLSAIERMDDTSGKKCVVPLNAQPNLDQARHSLDKLASALRVNDPRALEHLQALRPNCSGIPALESLDAVEAALNRLDFAGASAELPQLRAQVEGTAS
jgi:CheY-like chemotaxis protein